MQQVTERVPIMLRVKKELKGSATIRARKLCRSLNNYMESLLVKDLEPELPEEATEQSGEIDIDFLT